MPGKKAEALARFDGGPRKNDAVDLFGQQRGDGHGHGQVRLARAGGANGKDHVEIFERFDIALLIGALGRNDFFAEGFGVRGRKGAAGAGGWFAGGDAEKGFHFLAVRDAAFTDAAIVFVENLRGALDLRGRALDFQIVIAEVRGNVQGGLEQFQVFVEGAEQLVNAANQSYGLFHQVSLRRCLRATRFSS